MAKPILVANWKNYPNSVLEVRTLLTDLARKGKLYNKVSLFVAPPLAYFESVSERISRFGQLASQDIAVLPSGHHTGQVTPDILKSFGTRLAIIGHSEQRALGVTSQDVAQKIKVALRTGIIPLVCVGEISRDQDGEHFAFLREEIQISLSSLDVKTDFSRLILAYEPVWAIGKKAQDAIAPVELSEMVIFIKKVLTDLFGRTSAERVAILYGGSVEPDNVKALFLETGIRGFLVGHASLKAKNFELIAGTLISK